MVLDFNVSAGAEVSRWAVVTLLPLLLGIPFLAGAQEPELLEPEKAFRISARALDEKSIEIRFAIADGYYMYRDRFRFETASGRLLADVLLPKGKVNEDPFFGRTQIYRREVRIRVPLTPENSSRGSVKLKVTSQGCADIGVCYIPLEQFVEVPLPGKSSDAPAALNRSASSPTENPLEALREGAAAASHGGSR